MLKNYLTIALRNLYRQKTHSFINVFSLALGLACCMLILLFVQNELSYDQFHENSDSIYRVYAERVRDNGSVFSFAFLPVPLGPAVKEKYPEIKRFTRLDNETVVVQRSENLFTERMLFADSNMLEIFSFPLLQGQPETALLSSNALVISEAVAIKYFGHTEVMGEELSIRVGDDLKNFIITGISSPTPENSSIRFEILAPFEQSAIFASRGTVWSSWNSFLFIELAENASWTDLNAKMKSFMAERDPEAAERNLLLQPLEDVHMNASIAGGLEPTSDPTYSYILGAIALLVLTIACINFMTLSIGRATKRLKEVGMRKVLGAVRPQLIKQFWAEAILMSFLSFLLGVLLAGLFLPMFNALAEKNLALSAFQNATMILALFSLILAVGVVSGSYPALVLSRFKPVELFQGMFRVGGKQRLNRILVVVQFSLAIILVVGALAMSRQLEYLQSMNLGFEQEQIVVLKNRADDREAAIQKLRQTLLQHSEIVNVTGAQFSFTSGYHTVGFEFQGKNYQALECRIDPNFLETMGIPVVSGRNFSPEITTDGETAVIVNEKFVSEFGLEEPLGTTFTFRGTPNMQIVGVVKDFNFRNLRETIIPMVMHNNQMARFGSIFVRIAPSQTRRALEVIENKWREINPVLPFEFSFLDENLARQYDSDQRWSNIVQYSSMFAIVVACLGLFGLAALTMHQRTKEIGVRKVLGASTSNLVKLVSGEFALMVGVASLIAWPCAWYAMQSWLEGFAYRQDPTLWTFIAAGGLALLIALATVSFHAIKAAATNPVVALQYE